MFLFLQENKKGTTISADREVTADVSTTLRSPEEGSDRTKILIVNLIKSKTNASLSSLRIHLRRSLAETTANDASLIASIHTSKNASICLQTKM